MERFAADLPYFYGDISREDAELILWDRDCIEGMYLIRSSQNKDAKYVLSLCSKKSVHHYRIKQTVDDLFFVHGVETNKFDTLPLLVNDIAGLICKPTIACNRALNKLKPGHYYRLSSDELQRAIENKAQEWGIDGALLQSAQKQGLQSVVINSLHESQPWFHGKISRSSAEQRLIMDGHDDGKFLIRERDDCCSYALCFSHNSEMKHYKIEIISTGEMRIKDGPRFDNLLELVSHYSVLNDGLWCTLKEPCPRSRFPRSAGKPSDNPNVVNHRVPVKIPPQPLLQPVRAAPPRPCLEPPPPPQPHERTKNAEDNKPSAPKPTETEPSTETSVVVVPKKKSSFMKALPDLNLLKIAKAAQAFRKEAGASSSPVSPSPSVTPTSPMSVTSPTEFKSFAIVAEQSNVDLRNGAKDSAEKLNESAIGETTKDAQKKKRRAPVPLPRKEMPTAASKVLEDKKLAKNKEAPVPKPRKESAAVKAQESASAPAKPQAASGPCIGMSSVIKQLRQHLSVTESETTDSDANVEADDAARTSSPDEADNAARMSSPDEAAMVSSQESTEPIYQEIDPDYESDSKRAVASAPNDDVPAATDEGYDRETRHLGGADVSNNCLSLPRLHERENGNTRESSLYANSCVAPQPPSNRNPRLTKKSLSSPAFNLYANVTRGAPAPPPRKESLPPKAQPALRHSVHAPATCGTDLRLRNDKAQEQPESPAAAPSFLVPPMTNGHKNLTGLCRKPTWTREESEKHFRTVQRFRKNPMTINPKNIVLKEKMGTGNFGEVHKAHFRSDRVEVPFAVKMLKSTVPSAKADILREAKIMTGLDHPNIVRLIGICELENFMLVMELAPLGPLNQYLKSNISSVPIADVLQILYQIACGMEYLEKEMFVHRDLAARNVLLVNENFAKISDFGMSRVVGLDKDYYQMKNLEGKLPLKWYAPECIQYCKFSSKTDVWSYGITAWEAMSYGERPYMGMAGQEIWKMLVGDRRLERPPNCPDDVYAIMLQCWKFSADERPTFKELTCLVQDCIQRSSASSGNSQL